MKNRNKVPTQKTKNNSSVFINRFSKKITNFAFMIDEKSSESSLEATPVLASSLHVYLVFPQHPCPCSSHERCTVICI